MTGQRQQKPCTLHTEGNTKISSKNVVAKAKQDSAEDLQSDTEARKGMRIKQATVLCTRVPHL